ncbi:MAG: hypothetical protein JRJ51_13885 [Deltaproteobacteria bacterium]|nr:hypothetical protein [Deltaproteobacteria bacterium]MBW1943907.1 hypothetical protein [Deltaproteobacteria bacterium]
MRIVKKLIIIAVVGGVFYFFLAYHIIIVGNGMTLLEKSTLTLNYTFFSTKGKTNKTILAIDELREDGIGDVLYEEGLITEAELERILQKYNEEES